MRLFFLIMNIFLVKIAFSSSLDINVNLVTFNVLGPLWVNPDTYLPSTRPLLQREFRREKIISTLNNLSAHTDIFALQETTEIEYLYFKEALKDIYEGFQVFHDPSYWENERVRNQPWERNGVALFLKKSVFQDINFFDVPLTNDGNHAAVAFARFVSNPQLMLRAASVHLDSQRYEFRKQELNELMTIIPPQNNSIDIIGGDFNQNTRIGNIAGVLKEHGFIDVLANLKHEGPTHPFDSISDPNNDDSIIDHIVTRRAVPKAGAVINYNLWQLFFSDEEKRVNSAFLFCGSDHFPVMGSVVFNL